MYDQAKKFFSFDEKTQSKRHTMPIETFNAPKAPPAIGPYSHGVVVQGTLLYTSGQVALNEQGEMVGNDVAEQTQQVFRNLNGILAAKGATLSNVVKTTVFLADMADFAAMNEVYSSSFGDHRPARSTFQVARLPKDARVEIEVVACID